MTKAKDQGWNFRLGSIINSPMQIGGNGNRQHVEYGTEKSKGTKSLSISNILIEIANRFLKWRGWKK